MTDLPPELLSRETLDAWLRNDVVTVDLYAMQATAAAYHDCRDELARVMSERTFYSNVVSENIRLREERETVELELAHCRDELAAAQERIAELEKALEGEREACARLAESSVTVECCGKPRSICRAIDEKTGECLSWDQECCGEPTVTPHYPQEIAANIRARAALEKS